MDQTKRMWQEHHYKMAEKSDEMFRKKAQGKEIDV